MMNDMNPVPLQKANRNRLWLQVMLVAGLAIACIVLVRIQQPSLPATQIGAITVEGDARFTMQVKAALDLLESKDRAAYDIVKQYVPRIVQGEHSGMWAYANPPHMEIARPTADATTTWLASSIAHDSIHSKLYADYRRDHGLPVPDEQWSGKAVELRCCQYQTQVLKNIEAPKSEIEWCDSQDGSHADINGDGKLDWDDWNKRNW